MVHDLPSRPAQSPDTHDAFRHAALFYSGERAFVDATAAFIRDGVAAGEPTLVVVSARKIGLLKAELGPVAERAMFADMAGVGTNPGAIISAWDDFVSSNAAEGLRMRGVGEPVWSGRTDAELTECKHHEALLNLAFADAPGFWLVCPYDIDTLSDAVVHDARCTHPYVIDSGVEAASPVYAAGGIADTMFDEPLEDPPGAAYEVAFDEDSLPAMRAFVGELAIDAGILGARRDDLLLAVNELATNSVRHGGGEGMLRVWYESFSLVCEVSDQGRIEPPLTGRFRPGPGDLSGYGLWLVNQVCDLVQVRASDGRNVVRMRMRRG
jgi:anti-sigma regulatory factor (Ser/Thr protein kinase)